MLFSELLNRRHGAAAASRSVAQARTHPARARREPTAGSCMPGLRAGTQMFLHHQQPCSEPAVSSKAQRLEKSLTKNVMKVQKHFARQRRAACFSPCLRGEGFSVSNLPQTPRGCMEVSDPESGAAKTALKMGRVEQFFDLPSILGTFP